jgi:uncharacterized protein YjbI with pentapeptide repeats
MSTNFKVSLSVAVVFLSICSIHICAQQPTPALSKTEKYVLEQLGKGALADLTDMNEQEKTIPAQFLEDLLINSSGRFKIHRNGIQIKGALIPGILNLSNSEIRYFVDLSNCRFDDVYFFQTVLTKGMTLNGSSFEGTAYFGYATVMEGLAATGTHFNRAEEVADFNAIKVTGPAIFDQATFAGGVTFLYAVIDGSFGIKEAHFDNEAKEVSFNTMKIDRGFFAEGATFKGPVNLINLKIGDNFEARKTHFYNHNGTVDFEMMSTGHHVLLSGAEFYGPVDLTSANVNGTLELDGTHFENTEKGPAFRDTRANLMSIDGATFSRPADFSNLTYQNVYPLSSLFDLIKASESNYAAYTELESCLQRNGLVSQADEVFVEGKRYERRTANQIDWVKSYLSDRVYGYGRKPHRILFVDLAFVLVGVLFFRQRRMALKAPSGNGKDVSDPQSREKTPPYNSFLYSLTLFAPAIDTQYTNNWEPGPAYRKTRMYMRVHTILGYALIPLTIAIWTGIFK